MTKYVSKDRLALAIRRLADFRQLVHSQNAQHILPLLAMKWRGVNTSQDSQFEESDDFAFWDAFFSVTDDSVEGQRYPYYDPFAGERRINTHPHSNVATARKKTFARSWDAATFKEGDDGETLWKLAKDYLQKVKQRSLTKSGTTSLVPILDLIAWLRRSDSFPDDASQSDLVAEFKKTFNLSDAEFNTLFTTTPPRDLFAAAEEREIEFFSPDPITPSEILVLVGPPVQAIPPVVPVPVPVPLPIDGARSPMDTDDISVPAVIAPEEFTADATSVGAGLAVPKGVVEQAITALAAGSHLILAGPPGTGKSTLAESLGTTATRSNYTAGYLTVTATADWTTFDTIGGYMPAGSGNELVFVEGVVLRSIAQDNWCIIDELNRANIDKAIGALITLLAGAEETAIVELPYRHTVGEEQRVEPISIRRDVSQQRSGKDKDSGDYVIGRNWRLLATMNTLDRNNLFPLTAAFARRFATVYVGIPQAEEALDVLGVPDGVARQVFIEILTERDDQWTNPRPLGPAIVKDAWRYVVRRASAFPEGEADTVLRNAVLESLVLYVLPQYSGLEPAGWEPLRDRLVEAIIEGVADDAQTALRDTARETLDAALRGLQGEQ